MTTTPVSAALALAWPLQSPAALNAFYGNPDANGDGKPDPKWEEANIVKIAPLYPMIWAFDTDADGKLDDPVKGIRIHKLCVPAFNEFCRQVLAWAGSQERIEELNLHRFGGAYNFRAKRGNSKSLSTHSWGCAWDLDPANNGFRQAYRPGVSLPLEVIAIAKKLKADAGADWNPADCMHFQFARIR